MASSHRSPRRQAHSLAASALLLSSTMLDPVSGHALPRQTPRPTQVIQSWPLQPTPAPRVPPELSRRQFNTVCGYIGGNPDLPATCLAGSHCVVDAEKKAIGCCPDDGDCGSGIFTGCVDENTPGRGVVDPHIFTCGAGNVCYKNTFEGGFFQYGCGSASDLATNVALSASGESSLTYMSVSVSLSPTTTLASVTSSGSSSSPGSGASSTTSSKGSSKPTGTKDASNDDDDDGSHNHTSAIVGGVIGGLAALILLLALAFWLWRRSKKSKAPEAEDEPKFIRQVPAIMPLKTISLTRSSRPLASPDNEYDGNDDMTDTRPAPKPPVAGRQPDDTDSWPIPPTARGGAVIGGAQSTNDTDQTPLTQDNALSPTNNIDNFSPVETGSLPRRGGERPFWQQTGGGRTRNLTRQ